MRSLLIISTLFLFSLSATAGMSDIDLEVRTIIADELDQNPDDIHSLNFSENSPGCTFVVNAKVDNNSCDVCFQGTMENAYASDVVCEREWLFDESEQ